MKVTMTEAICHEGMALLEGKADIFVAHDACPHNYLDQMKDTDAFIVRIADKGAVDRETMKSSEALKVIGRNHFRVDDAHFELLFRHRHDGVGRGLGAGPSGGGDHQGLHALLGPAGLIQQLLHSVLVRHQDAGQLGGIHDAAAAHGHDEVRATLFALVHQLLGLHVRGLRRELVQDYRLHAGLPNLRHRKLQQARALNALVGENHQALDSVGGKYLGDPPKGILAAVDSVGHFQFVLR